MIYVVVATDTDVGKTVVATMLALNLSATYWKPIQSGLDQQTDSQFAKKILATNDAVLPEAYRLQMPASPHIAAMSQKMTIDCSDIGPLGTRQIYSMMNKCKTSRLIIEGVGGVMVPINDKKLLIDMLAMWKFPIIICVRAAVGTINHSLLTLEALQAREIPIKGIVCIGSSPTHESSISYICQYSGVRNLGFLPWQSVLDRVHLRAAFADHFDVHDFVE